jgi:flagellar basal-body rod protein FlgB
VQPVYLFDLASRHAQWTSVRQATITSNIANADTPGFEALDVEPFGEVLDKTALVMAKTSAGHIDVESAGLDPTKVKKIDSWDVTHSGNSVSIDQEMIKAAEVNGAYSLNTNIVRAFHRMMMASVRTGS